MPLLLLYPFTGKEDLTPDFSVPYTEKVEHTIKEILDMAQKLMDEIYEKTVSF